MRKKLPVFLLCALLVLCTAGKALCLDPQEVYAQCEAGELYRLTDVFQEGSFYGPQDVDTAPQSRLLFAVPDAEDLLYAIIENGMAELETMLDVFALELDVATYDSETGPITDVLTRVINNNPRFFMYKAMWRPYYDPEDEYIRYIELYQNELTIDHVGDYETEIAAMIERAAPVRMRDSMTEAEIALALHDELVAHAAYDYEAYAYADSGATNSEVVNAFPNVFNAYGAIVDKKAVCQGFSLGYMDMLQRVGISAAVVATTTYGHAWNIVCADGNWYHVDLTWDNPLVSCGESIGTDWLGYVHHTYFLLSDAQIKTYTHHYSWDDPDLTAPSAYDGTCFWSGINSALCYDGGLWYYNTGALDAANRKTTGNLAYKTSSNENAGTAVENVSFADRWGGKLIYYNYAGTGLFAYDMGIGTEQKLIDVAASHVGELTVNRDSLNYWTCLPDGLYSLVLSDLLSKGDVDADRFMEAEDAMRICGHIMGKSLLTDTQFANADVNGDSAVTILDMIREIQYLRGNIPEFPE